MFNGKIDQLAFIAYNDEDEARIKAQLGLSDAKWVEDNVVATGTVKGHAGTNVAKLLFNYDMGMEVEILRYTDGDNYADGIPGGHICHYGIHAEADKPAPTFDAPIIQEVYTTSHTNEYLLSTGRTYHYTIYDTRATLGVCTKVIERIEANS